MLKEKALNFGGKLPNLDTFLDCNLKQKNYCLVLNQQARISQSTKFHVTNKHFEIGTKTDLFH